MANKKSINLKDLLPGVLQNENINTLLGNLFGQFLTSTDTVKIDGFVGRKTDDDPILAENLDRELNALTPAIHFSVGSEEFTFTFFDIINRLNSLGIDISNLKDILAEKNFNLFLPIDYDKFSNFQNYFWVGKSLPISGPSYNQDLDPEYYTIQRPSAEDSIKFPAKLASNSHLHLYSTNRPPETFTLKFIAPDSFDAVSNGSGNIGFVTDHETDNLKIRNSPGEKTTVILSADNNSLCSFVITVGSSQFSVGDEFKIKIRYFSSEISVQFFARNKSGKGTISSIKTEAELMSIDGIQIAPGFRILATAQNNPAENGVYVVSLDSKWKKAYDFSTESFVQPGTRVFIESGISNSGKTFELSESNEFTALPAGTKKDINEWQEFNLWIHKDDFQNNIYSGYVDIDTSIQASRPIIEYSNRLELNSFTDSGTPSNDGSEFPQLKFSLNQIPQFNLYHYDGTHAGKTSGIFYFEESTDSIIDTVLKRRIKKTADNDYVFGMSTTDESGRLLYFKMGDDLHGFWSPGVNEPQIISKRLNGQETNLISVIPSRLADNQTWELIAFTTTQFKVHGSRSGYIGIASRGIPFIHDEIAVTVQQENYSIGDVFSFSVVNKIFPRYVSKLNGKVLNHTQNQDVADDSNECWLTPIRMFQNIERENRRQINFADLLNHLRSVIAAQDLFEGAPFSNNNFRNIQHNFGLGGKIREFDKEFPLLLSLLAQKDVTILSSIDLAEEQYLSGLSSIDTFIQESLVDFVTNYQAIITSAVDAEDLAVQSLLQYFCDIRSQNEHQRAVFSDSSAKIPNWPATLPMIGLCAAVKPEIEYDLEYNIPVLKHHDGHTSPLTAESSELNRSLAQIRVKRSDGNLVAGIAHKDKPTAAYARQLWFNPQDSSLRIFNVDFDTPDVPEGVSNQYWFNRNSGILKKFDSEQGSWVITQEDRWHEFTPSVIRNSLMLAVENLLFDSVHPLQEQLGIITDAHLDEAEFFLFAKKYELDPKAPDYNAKDSFTWNYKNAVRPPKNFGNKSRWHDIYDYHFEIPGTLGELFGSTHRPDLEPWKLLKISEMPSQIFQGDNINVSELNIFIDSFRCETVENGNEDTVLAAALLENSSDLFGLRVIDSHQLSLNDRVIVVDSNPQNNGLYKVLSGQWSKIDLLHPTIVQVVNGKKWHDSKWKVENTSISQLRKWSDNLWDLVKGQHPNLKLCVNTRIDELLPPYINSSFTYEQGNRLEIDASNTLFTSSADLDFSRLEDSYSFGDNGPVELIWKKSLEINYGKIRSYFRKSPLEFVSATWGESYVVGGNNVKVMRDTGRPLSSRDILLHGEKRKEAVRDISKSFSCSSVQGDDSRIILEVTLCNDNSTIFDITIDNSKLPVYVQEGVILLQIAHSGVELNELKIEDNGIPFNYGDKFIIDITSNNISNISFIPNPRKILKGTGQYFTNLIRHANKSNSSYTHSALREWNSKLVHRLGSLVNPNTFTADGSLGRLPTTAYSLQLKKNAMTKSSWMSAIRVQLVQIGSWTVDSFGNRIPKEDGNDWVFRIETYFPKSSSVKALTKNESANYQTFFALSKKTTSIEWKKFPSASEEISLNTPFLVTGIQNLVNYIFSIVDALEKDGWSQNLDYPVTDVSTGRNISWQLEIEKLIDAIYTGLKPGQGYILNPFSSKFAINTPVGMLGAFEENSNDAYMTQNLYDVDGKVIPLSKISVNRDHSVAKILSLIPVYSGHIFIDEFEHIMLINKTFSEEQTSSTLFDPYLGIAIDTLRLSYDRKSSTDKRPNFDGFYVSGDTYKSNILSSIDNIGNYYDSVLTHSDPNTSKHALTTLGYTKKDYLDAVSESDVTKFNFWRGMIQAKGTNMTIDAFVNYKKFVNASVDEYWAYKIAEFGDSRERNYPEIKINTQDVTQKFTRLQFYDKEDTAYVPLPLFTQIEKSDDTRWFSIDDLGKGFAFESKTISEEIVITENVLTPKYFQLKNIYHNGDGIKPILSTSGSGIGQVINSNIIRIDSAHIGDKFLVSGITWDNPSKFSPVKLFDYTENALISEITQWHPAIGIHAYSPLEIISDIRSDDPALYNLTTKVTNNSNYQRLKPWGQKEVGRVWWNTKDLDYIPYYDSTVFESRESREARWGLIAEWSKIQLCEWVESKVHPSKYDDLAISEEGNYEIPSSIRASGRVANKKYYSRDRIISATPIAWSESASGNNNAHPSFGPARFSVIYALGNGIVAESGRIADLGIIPGKRLGAWKTEELTPSTFNSYLSKSIKPIGEVEILDSPIYSIGNDNEINKNSYIISLVDTPISINIAALSDSRLGEYLGDIRFLSAGIGKLRLISDDNNYEDVEIDDWFSSGYALNYVRNFDFEKFGIRITIDFNSVVDFDIPSNDIVTALTAIGSIKIREGLSYQEILPLPADILVNDPSSLSLNGDINLEYLNFEYGWICWNVPTQEDLDNDLPYPRNKWQPYLGDAVELSINADLVSRIKQESEFILKSGIIIRKFTTSWTDWTELTSSKISTISNGQDEIKFEFDGVLDQNRVSVYANGIQLNPSTYIISDNQIELKTLFPEGTRVLFYYRAYQPTVEELEFDPSKEDDLTILTQYKQDFEFTEIDMRDEEGNITGKKYYFWVQDKTIPTGSSSTSLIQAKHTLQYGPDQYLIMARARENLTYATSLIFDSCSIVGLNTLVTKNNSFKLRFLRNFTLRDDPEEMNLKTSHEEWTLIRKKQNSKIPRKLWQLLINSACAQDSSFNELPYKVFSDYDIRNGTRTRYGFNDGQIFADSDLVITSVKNTLVNTELTIKIGNILYPDYIKGLNIDNIDVYFSSKSTIRETLEYIWNIARPKQINEIFFNVLEDALASNYEFSDIFKTSYITVSSSSEVVQNISNKQEEIF